MKKMNLLKITFIGFALLSFVGCSQDKPSGSSSGGGGYVSKNSKLFLEKTQARLAMQLRMSSPKIYENFPEGWNGIRIAKIIENMRLTENVEKQRDGKDLMFNFVDNGSEQYLEVLKPYFVAYANTPISIKGETQLFQEMMDLSLIIMHELAHIILDHKNYVAQGKSVQQIEDEAERFGFSVLMALFSDYLVCEATQQPLKDLPKPMASEIIKRINSNIAGANSLLILEKSFAPSEEEQFSGSWDDVEMELLLLDRVNDKNSFIPKLSDINDSKISAWGFVQLMNELKYEIANYQLNERNNEKYSYDDLAQFWADSSESIGGFRLLSSSDNSHFSLARGPGRFDYNDYQTFIEDYQSANKYFLQVSHPQLTIHRKSDATTVGVLSFDVRVANGVEADPNFDQIPNLNYIYHKKLQYTLSCVEHPKYIPSEEQDFLKSLAKNTEYQKARDQSNEYYQNLSETFQMPGAQVESEFNPSVESLELLQVDQFIIDNCKTQTESKLNDSEASDTPPHEIFYECVDAEIGDLQSIFAHREVYLNSGDYNHGYVHNCFYNHKYGKLEGFTSCVADLEGTDMDIQFDRRRKVLGEFARAHGVSHISVGQCMTSLTAEEKANPSLLDSYIFQREQCLAGKVTQASRIRDFITIADVISSPWATLAQDCRRTIPDDINQYWGCLSKESKCDEDNLTADCRKLKILGGKLHFPEIVEHEFALRPEWAF